MKDTLTLIIIVILVLDTVNFSNLGILDYALLASILAYIAVSIRQYLKRRHP